LVGNPALEKSKHNNIPLSRFLFQRHTGIYLGGPGTRWSLNNMDLTDLGGWGLSTPAPG